MQGTLVLSRKLYFFANVGSLCFEGFDPTLLGWLKLEILGQLVLKIVGLTYQEVCQMLKNVDTRAINGKRRLRETWRKTKC